MAGFQPKTYLCRLMSLMPLFNAAQEVVASICLYLRQQYRKCHWPSSQRLVDLNEGQKSPVGTKNSNWTTAGINVVDLTYHSKVSVHPLSLHRRSTRTTIWRRKQSMQDQIIIMKAQNGNLPYLICSYLLYHFEDTQTEWHRHPCITSNSSAWWQVSNARGSFRPVCLCKGVWLLSTSHTSH